MTLITYFLCLLLKLVKPGVRFREIGDVINRHALMSGFSVVSMALYFLLGSILVIAWRVFIQASNTGSFGFR